MWFLLFKKFCALSGNMEPTQKEHYLRLNNRPFKAIQNGTKRIEIRANKYKNISESFKPGDFIVFTNNETNQTMRCKVTRVNLYPTVRNLLEIEGLSHTLSSGLGLEEGIKSIESIGDYKNIINNHGVLAITLECIF